MTDPTDPEQPLTSDNPVWQEIIDHIDDPAPETIEGVAAAVRGDWQDISSAPDATVIIGLRADGAKYGVVIGVKHDLMHKRPDWILDEWNGVSVRCSHWMPLPAPPAAVRAMDAPPPHSRMEADNG